MALRQRKAKNRDTTSILQDNMAADILTKALTKERHIKLVGLMGIKEVKVSQSGSIGSYAAQPCT